MGLMKGKRIVVTGGCGFIGSNLARQLCSHNEVIVIDNMSTGRLTNIEDLISSRKIKLIIGSVTDFPLMKKTLKGIDVVFHQAALPSVTRSVRDPITTNDVNIGGTLTTLVAARDCDVGRVVYASSSSVYGDILKLPKRENMCPNPLSPYALSKLAAERYSGLFHDIYDLSTVSLRYFNVYGPYQDESSEYSAVIPRFIDGAMKRKKLQIFGDGRQTRDFTFIRDVVAANIKAANSKYNGVCNIASGKRISIIRLAELISEKIGAELCVKHLPPRQGDIKHSLADISCAKHEIGYVPAYSISDGLDFTVEWFRNKIINGS